MLVKQIDRALLCLGILAALALANLHSLVAQSLSQPTATQVVHRIHYSRLLEIHVDQDCHILPPTTQTAGIRKTRLRKDPLICHLESIAASDHVEETITGNQVRRSKVSIQEQTYVLQNVTTDSATFVVNQLLPEGWFVDSDPQPTQLNGQIAVFKVSADPGQTVRLHEGLRHIKLLHTRFIKTSPLAPAQSHGG